MQLQAAEATESRRWHAGGLLAGGHVVLMVTGILVQSTPSLSEGEAGILRYYARGDMTRILTGGYLELLGFVLMLPVVVLLATELGRRTEAGRWASTSAGAFGVGYVAMTVGSGLAPGAAALWGTHHGLDPTTALVVNDVRNFAFFLGLALLGAHTLGVALAALADGWATRRVGWGGVVTGTVLLCSVPLAGVGLADVATLVWIVWWVTLAVAMVRAAPVQRTGAEEPLPAGAQQ
jgi:hypothetical protein